MVLKVRHKELNEVKEKMLSNSQKLDSEIENLLKYFNELKSVWQGIDSDTFYKESYNYVNRMRSISECLKEMGNFINKANNSYETIDNTFKEKLEIEAQKYE